MSFIWSRICASRILACTGLVMLALAVGFLGSFSRGCLVTADVVMEHDNQFKLFHTDGVFGENEVLCNRIRLSRGTSRLWCVIPTSRLNTLRLDPGMCPGHVQIRGLRVRGDRTRSLSCDDAKDVSQIEASGRLGTDGFWFDSGKDAPFFRFAFSPPVNASWIFNPSRGLLPAAVFAALAFLVLACWSTLKKSADRIVRTLGNLLSFGIDCDSRFGRWLSVLVIVSVTVVVVAFMVAMLYFGTLHSTVGAESELCLWNNLAHQALRWGLGSGVIFTYYYRSIVEFFVNLAAVKVGLGGIPGAFTVYAGQVAVSYCLAALTFSLAKEERVIRFYPIRFCLFMFLSPVFYLYNLGHSCTYLLAAGAVFLFASGIVQGRWRTVLLCLLTAAGYLNDDLFLMVFVLPALCICFLEYAVGGRIEDAVAPVLSGVLLGFVLLRILIGWRWFAYPSITPRLVPMDQVGIFVKGMLKDLAFVLRFSGKVEHAGGFVGTLSVLMYLTFAVSSVLSAVFLLRRLAIRPMRSVAMFLAVLWLGLGFLMLTYCLVDSPTKVPHDPVPRYLYWGMNAFVGTMVFYATSRRSSPAGKVLVALVCLCVCLIGFREHVSIMRRNRDNRSDMNELVAYLEKNGLKSVYAEYWTANALAAASRGKVEGYVCHLHPPQAIPHLFFHHERSYHCPCQAVIVSGLSDPDRRIASAVARFGAPDKVVDVGLSKVMVYSRGICLEEVK